MSKRLVFISESSKSLNTNRS